MFSSGNNDNNSLRSTTEKVYNLIRKELIDKLDMVEFKMNIDYLINNSVVEVRGEGDTLYNEKDLVNETLDSLIEKQFIKCNVISNRECLSLPKDSESHYCLIQPTQEDSSVHEHLNPFSLLDSETNRKSFHFKDELETFKVQVISEIKNLILKEISVLNHHAFQH